MSRTKLVFDVIEAEWHRQERVVNLIASENYASEDVMRATGSCLTNKYSEGYPAIRWFGGCRGRYYGGCENIDSIEEVCCAEWQNVFRTDYHVNVQPHSGSNANLAALIAVMSPGDTMLTMSLNDGGHLSHGHKVNITGKLFNVINYPLTDEGLIDYGAVRALAQEHNPKVIIAGASAYSREINYEEFAKIAASVNAYLIVDMAHIAGLIAAGLHPTPFGLADIITTTTHKTLRGPRGGMIFCKRYLAEKIDKAVFPGVQGGPLQNVIAAKLVCAMEDNTEVYCKYMREVKENAKAMSDEFIRLGYNVVSGGTDTHLFVLDLSKTGLTGAEVQAELETHDIIVNKNCIHNDPLPATAASGIRIGTPAMTTRGWKKQDFIRCANKIHKVIEGMETTHGDRVCF